MYLHLDKNKLESCIHVTFISYNAFFLGHSQGHYIVGFLHNYFWNSISIRKTAWKIMLAQMKMRSHLIHCLESHRVNNVSNHKTQACYCEDKINETLD